MVAEDKKVKEDIVVEEKVEVQNEEQVNVPKKRGRKKMERPVVVEEAPDQIDEFLSRIDDMVEAQKSQQDTIEELKQIVANNEEEKLTLKKLALVDKELSHLNDKERVEFLEPLKELSLSSLQTVINTMNSARAKEDTSNSLVYSNKNTYKASSAEERKTDLLKNRDMLESLSPQSFQSLLEKIKM